MYKYLKLFMVLKQWFDDTELLSVPVKKFSFA